MTAAMRGGRTRRRSWGRGALRVLLLVPLLVAGYLLAALGLGAVPTGRPAAAGSGNVPIFVLSNGYHASFILPLRAADIDWAERFPAADFAAPPIGATHVMFGWGDRDFYMNTRRVADIRPGTALAALASLGESVIQVTMLAEPATSAEVRRLELSLAQYRALAGFVEETFRREQGRLVLHPGKGYGRYDAFYAATGHYNLFLTCNEWVGRGLRRAGAPTGLWTPLAQSVLWHL